MEEAEAQLYRRIQELRTRARGEAPAPDVVSEAKPAMPDLRTILARAETHVDELRSTAATLEETLPARVERAVERAMSQHSDARRADELRELLRGLSRQIEQVNLDLLAERLGRVEDLELVVDLISTGMAALRQDVATLAAMVEQVGGGVDGVIEKLDQPLQVTVERPQRSGVRDLFQPTGDEPPAAS
jgi:chromosome segregation ATPase